MTDLKHSLISIGIDKNNEIDFRVSGGMGALPFDKMNEVRAMLPVAIWAGEDMWRQYQEIDNVAKQTTQGDSDD